MPIHELKTWPRFYISVSEGQKNFEIRYDDRGFFAGDWLLLKEYDPKTKEYTGRQTRRQIRYILKNHIGLEQGYVILGF